MRWLAPLLLLGFILSTVPAFAQMGQLGPSGDFRVNDRPGTAPTVGPAGGPSPAPESTLFRDFAGMKSPDEILKSLDKDLGRNPVSDSEAPSSGPSIDLERDLRAPGDKFFK